MARAFLFANATSPLRLISKIRLDGFCLTHRKSTDGRQLDSVTAIQLAESKSINVISSITGTPQRDAEPNLNMGRQETRDVKTICELRCSASNKSPGSFSTPSSSPYCCCAGWNYPLAAGLDLSRRGPCRHCGDVAHSVQFGHLEMRKNLSLPTPMLLSQLTPSGM